MTEQSKNSQTAAESNELLERSSFLFGANAAFIEALYARYQENPDAVEPSWRAIFRRARRSRVSRPPSSDAVPPGGAMRRLQLENGELVSALTGQWPAKNESGAVSEHDLRAAAQESVRAIQLIRAYRVIGHLAADLDPLKLNPRPPLPQLDPNFYGFHEAELDKPVFIDGVLGLETATPRQMVEILKRTYCGRIGYEFMHINDPEQKDWLQRRIEGPDKEISFTNEGKRAILNKLIEAEGFEKFAALRFVGTKRFGLDGGEAMVPAARADHQARRPARREGDRARHGASRPAQCARQCDGQALSPDLPRIPGRQRQSQRSRRARAT